MAMRKTVGPPPPLPKPSRPGGPSAATSGRTPSRVPTGKRKPNPVVKVQPKKPLTKGVVRNPKAPKPVGSGTSVTLLQKGESGMKRGKAGRNRSGGSMSSKNTTKNYTTTREGQRAKENQRVKNTPDRGSVSSFNDLKARDAMMRSAAGGKGGKPTKVTPKKKAEAPKKATPKRRLFMGRGGGMRGGAGGGGGFPGNMNQ